VLARLLFLFVVIPLMELALLLLLAKTTGSLFTILMVLASGALGAYLMKQQGFAAWRRIRGDVSQGRVPAGSGLDGLLILIAGLLLLTPGVLTDVAGLSLLFPPVRRRYKAWLAGWFKSRFRVETFLPRDAKAPRSEVIDSYAVEGSRVETPDDSETPRS
jgi:UPF0716 protein FxsA